LQGAKFWLLSNFKVLLFGYIELLRGAKF